MGNFIDISGERFGRWKVLDSHRRFRQKTEWLCECECGIRRYIPSGDLRSGHSKSCGCLKSENAVRNERLYKIWLNMKQRCNNPKSKDYKYYGARGISVCSEWLTDYAAFRKWAYSNGYSQDADYGKCTIDRIDNDGDYEPTNCRWVDMKVQNHNKGAKAEHIMRAVGQ